MENDIMVSICCLAYNQEKYIRQTLDGFLMQKCEFKFEIIIHDDASTDHTAEIIREYEEKYPDIIKPIYQSENQYSKGKRVLLEFVYPSINGKYFALCEGDDFWSDCNKLNLQYKCLENHSDCKMCLHKVEGISENGESNKLLYPNFSLKEGILSRKELIDYICTNDYVFQTSCYFGESKCIYELLSNTPQFYLSSSTGDTPLLLYFATKGNFYFIDRIMSSYRHDSSSSVERRNTYNDTEDKIVKWFNKQITMLEEFDNYTNGSYHYYCKRKIKGYDFDRALRNNDYKEVIKPKYWYFTRKYSFKGKLILLLKAFGIK